jgi:hypothetical protein
MKQDNLLACIKYARFLLYDVKLASNNSYCTSKVDRLDDYLLELHNSVKTEDNILQKFLTFNPQFAKKDGTLSKQKKDVKMYDEFKKKEEEL